MIDKLEKAVSLGETLGANFVEVRYDNLTLRTLKRINDTWKDIISRTRSGIGITCYFEGAQGYAFTASTESQDIEEAVKKAYKIAKTSVPAVKLKLDFDKQAPIKKRPSDGSESLVKIHPREENLDFKIDLVNRIIASGREHGENIINIRGLYGEFYGQKLFVNSECSKIDWEFELTDLRCYVTSKTDEGNLVDGAKGVGGTNGLEIFKAPGTTPEEIGETAGSNAKEQLSAKACPAGKFRSLTENALTGVLAHESFGHLSEADFVVTGGSPLSGKIDQKLGTEYVTIIDTGKPDVAKVGGLWVPFDDQGIRGNETVIMENGVLKNYLHNRGTAKHMNQLPTGNCRAIHFGFMPIPRMTNTYFMSGDLTEEEALEQLGTGIYAIQSAGGQVSLDGNFLFKAIRGYWVENGEKKYPIREVSLSGNILNLLSKVEGATKELELFSGYFGGCGKDDQYPLPVGTGGPKLLFSEVTFGGKA
ncbi:MAG: TldD/PmbA family protein [Candidatus Hermodarchaeota archaeon]